MMLVKVRAKIESHLPRLRTQQRAFQPFLLGMGDRCEFSTILERMPNVKSSTISSSSGLIDPAVTPSLSYRTISAEVTVHEPFAETLGAWKNCAGTFLFALCTPQVLATSSQGSYW
jgi:hypothetical protein